MGKLFEIISVGPKCNHMHLNKRETEGDLTQTEVKALQL